MSIFTESITLADSLFSEILLHKEKADKTRTALNLLTRHKFLFQLPASIDKNIRLKEYDLVVNDYTRVKNLFGTTDVNVCISHYLFITRFIIYRYHLLMKL